MWPDKFSLLVCNNHYIEIYISNKKYVEICPSTALSQSKCWDWLSFKVILSQARLVAYCIAASALWFLINFLCNRHWPFSKKNTLCDIGLVHGYRRVMFVVCVIFLCDDFQHQWHTMFCLTVFDILHLINLPLLYIIHKFLLIALEYSELVILCLNFESFCCMNICN